MTTASFVRNLGGEVGVQLNALQDRSGIPTFGDDDQSFAVAMRATRGRIDKPFVVDRSNVRQRLGPGEPTRTNALNEAYVLVREALDSGAYQAVVHRLHTDAAVLSWIVCAEDSGSPGEYLFTTSATAPEGAYLFAIKHMECFNGGITVEFRADAKRAAGAAAANDKITIRIREPDGVLLDEVTGSLNAASVDDYGNSEYLPNVVERVLGDRYEVLVGADAALGTDPETYGIPTTSDAYGYDAATGAENWVVSDVMDYFAEGGTAYDAEDYLRARNQLYDTEFGYGYIASAGSQAVGLLAQLAALAHDMNRQMRFDVPGSLSVDAAITWVEQLNFDEADSAHLLHAFWAPIKTDCPVGINGKGYYGTALWNIARSCARNAVTDANGFARKHYAVAGKDWPLGRSGVVQVAKPTPQQFNALSAARINPVVFQTFAGGGLYVVWDVLTQAQVENSLKKLIPVAEMSTAIDTFVTRFGKEALLLPMDVAVTRTGDALKRLFGNAVTAGWLVSSDEPEMGGNAYVYEVRPNAQRPHDRMDVSYRLRYTGTNRQTVVTQTLSR